MLKMNLPNLQRQPNVLDHVGEVLEVVEVTQRVHGVVQGGQ